MRFQSHFAMLACGLGAVSLAASLFACSSSKDAPQTDPTPDGGAPPNGGPDGQLPASCAIDAPTSCPAPEVKYADVQPIFDARCVSTCHSGTPGGPWPLTDYGHVSDWADSIRSELLACAMPPLDAGVPITKEEKLAILTWVRCGTPP